MPSYTYIVSQTIPETTAFLTQHGSQARVLAGGTDLLVQLQSAIRLPQYIVDVKKIPELNELSYDPTSGLTIGAAVPCFRIWNNATVSRLYPGLIDAVSLIGGIQIQSRATLGGNVANASPAADSIPALIVHHAVCEIAGPKGIRRVPVEAFCTGPGKNVLEPGEFLVRFHMKPPSPGFGAHYLRFIPRNEMDIAVASAGASVILSQDGNTIQSARVAIGAVAPTPLLVTAAGEALAGKAVSDEAIDEAATLATQAAQPITDVRGTIAQRKHLAAVLTRRALHKAIERARANLKGTSS